MDALELLAEQHQEVDELIALIEKTEGDRKAALFEELADQLAAHATIEEHIFYPAVLAAKTEDILLESAEEHLSIKRVLSDLMELDADDPHFDAKLAVMKGQLARHAHEEEEALLFPKVRRALSSRELETMGEQMEELFETLLEGSPRYGVPLETDRAADIEGGPV